MALMFPRQPSRASKPVVTHLIGGGGQPTRLRSHFGDRSEERVVPEFSAPDAPPFHHVISHSGRYSLSFGDVGDIGLAHMAAVCSNHPQLADNQMLMMDPDGNLSPAESMASMVQRDPESPTRLVLGLVKPETQPTE